MKSLQSVSYIALVSAILGALSPLSPAYAQSSDAAKESDDSNVIIVSARRRDERLQDVPIAVTAYSGEKLEQQGAIDITDLSGTTPNVTLENSRGTNSTLTAFIRGVGQQDPVAGFEAGVGIYLDDVYLNRPQSAVLDIYDVERIEILRGPQGTLYGRNTIGGAVKYVTKRLSQDPEFKARAAYGTYNQAEMVVTGSLPITDMVRVGASGARLSRGGFGDNLNIAGVENYNKDVWAGRASLEIGGYGEPALIRISGDYTKDNSDPRNGHRLIPGLVSGAPVLDDVFDNQAGLNSPVQASEAYGLAMNVSAELSDNVTLRSISAWRKDNSATPIDFDSLPVVDVDVPARYNNEQISQEFQLLYESDRLNGLLGFYYLDAQAATVFDVLLFKAVPSLPTLNATTEGDVDTTTWSVFGDFTFDITSQLSVSAGGRFTHDRRDAKVLRQTKLGSSATFGGTPIVLATTSNFTGSKTFEEFTPRASISFKPDSDNMVYASYSKGFKGGGFDPRGQSSQAADTNGDGVRSQQEIFDFFLFDPEEVDSFELGYRGSLLDRRLTAALTGFYSDYKNVQIPGSVGCIINGVASFCGVTTNAAKATFKGVELETNARLAENFAGVGSAITFAGTLGYIDGKFNSYIVNGIDVSGIRKIQNTPKWTLSGTLAAAVPAGGGVVNASTTVSYRSKTNQFEVPSSLLDQPGYALFDANLVWTSEGDRFSLGLHGKNLLNKEYITSGYQFLSTQPDGTLNRTAGGNVISTLGTEGIATAFYGNPRQIFVSAGMKF